MHGDIGESRDGISEREAIRSRERKPYGVGMDVADFERLIEGAGWEECLEGGIALDMRGGRDVYTNAGMFPLFVELWRATLRSVCLLFWNHIVTDFRSLEGCSSQ